MSVEQSPENTDHPVHKSHMGNHILQRFRIGVDLRSDIVSNAEIPENIEEILRDIRARGCKAGLSVKPKTDVRAVEKYLPLCDQVLVMTVEPGFGGQKFMADMMPKLRWLRENGFAGGVQVDGGVNVETARACVSAGADELVMGTALVRAEDPVAVIRACRFLEEKA